MTDFLRKQIDDLAHRMAMMAPEPITLDKLETLVWNHHESEQLRRSFRGYLPIRDCDGNRLG
jgi:hypothetical protein